MLEHHQLTHKLPEIKGGLQEAAVSGGPGDKDSLGAPHQDPSLKPTISGLSWDGTGLVVGWVSLPAYPWVWAHVTA